MITGQAPRDTPQRQNSEGVTTPRGPFTGPHRSPSFTLPPIGSSLELFQFTMSHLLLFPPAFPEAGDGCQGKQHLCPVFYFVLPVPKNLPPHLRRQHTTSGGIVP